jgi:hypothetical protein
MRRWSTCDADDFNGLTGPNRAFAPHFCEKTAAANNFFLQARINGVKHITWLASLGQFHFNAAGKPQPIADIQLINVQMTNGNVLTGRAGKDFKAFAAKIIQIFDIKDAERLNGRDVFFVVVPVAYQAVCINSRNRHRLFGDAAGRKINGDDLRNPHPIMISPVI